jgi:spermidine synthase
MIKLIKRASAEARAFRQAQRDALHNHAPELADGIADAPRGGVLKGGKNAARRAAKQAVKRGDQLRLEHDDDTLPASRAAAVAQPGMPKAGREAGGRRPRFAPVTFSEEGGVRYLHFGTEWVQGAMRLRHPWRLELEYAQQMMAWLLFLEAPARIVQLGLGAAALTKFCYRQFPASRVEAVELNPAVVIAARSMFALPGDDARLSVLESDAWDFVNDAQQRDSIGVLQIDLYDATARGPVLDSVAFYRACRACLSEPGMLSVNLFGDHPSFERNLKHLRLAFDGRVVALPEVHEGNRVVLAFNGPALAFSAEQLAGRARHLESTTELPARNWLARLHEATGRADFSI